MFCLDQLGRGFLLEADTPRMVMMPCLHRTELEPVSLYVPYDEPDIAAASDRRPDLATAEPRELEERARMRRLTGEKAAGSVRRRVRGHLAVAVAVVVVPRRRAVASCAACSGLQREWKVGARLDPGNHTPFFHRSIALLRFPLCLKDVPSQSFLPKFRRSTSPRSHTSALSPSFPRLRLGRFYADALISVAPAFVASSSQ